MSTPEPDLTTDTGTGDAPGPRHTGLGARLLAVPLFYKILVANAATVLLFSPLGT